MTVDELLAELRDIHLPASEVSQLGADGFSFWPLGVVIAILIALLLMRHWHAGAWRRRLVEDLDSFIATPDEQGVAGLLSLRHQVAEHGFVPPSLPAIFFGSPEKLDPDALREAGKALKGAVQS